jgi:predicted esterase
MTEHHISVSKTARYHQLGEVSAATREVWLCCHGYGQLAGRFINKLEAIASTERVIVAPEALHRFYLDSIDRSAAERRVGATWMTREDRETDISDYIAYLDRVCAEVLKGHTPQLIGLGFSQGTATLARWAAATHYELARLILWGSGLPPDLDWSQAEPRFRKLGIILVAGDQDSAAPAEQIAEQESLLAAHEVPFTTVHFDGGHNLHGATLQQIAGSQPFSQNRR